MADGKENVPEKKHSKKGTTRHCCYGTCTSDSRYSHRLDMTDVSWIPFPKPGRNKEKCLRWIKACGRANFTLENVKKWTYICSKHFVDDNGPTELHPNPIPATFTPLQVAKFTKKRKAPTPRAAPVSKRALFEASEALLLLFDGGNELDQQNLASSIIDTGTVNNELDQQSWTTSKIDTGIVNNSVGCQTQFVCNELVAGKIQTIINDNSKISGEESQDEDNSKFQYERLKDSESLFKFYSGLTVEQFDHLFDSFGDIVNHLIFWKGTKNKTQQTSKWKVSQ